jgi:hypothetical protein
MHARWSRAMTSSMISLGAMSRVVVLSDEEWFALHRHRDRDIRKGVDITFLGEGEPPESMSYRDIAKHPGRFAKPGQAS